MKALLDRINIAELWQKGKYWLHDEAVRDELLSVLVGLCLAVGSFATGRLSVGEIQSSEVVIEHVFSNASVNTVCKENTLAKDDTQAPQVGGVGKSASEPIVASKHGSKYHFPWCPGARTIKEENKIWFATEKDAEQAGYTKAQNCQ